MLCRWTAAAGRLTSHREFLADRDELRARWTKLSGNERPPLPLRSCLTLPPDVDHEEWQLQDPLSAEESSFRDAFRSFCDQWQVDEMTTWELPVPRGPKWPLDSLGDAGDGTVQLQTPWHFPLQSSDNVGAVAVAAHADLCVTRQVDDHDSWETYARLLPVSHWQTVCAERYPKKKNKRAKDFSARLNVLLAEVLGVTEERAKKLRSLLKALQSGRRTTLSGYR